nr:hypothetical protein GCM10025732_46550 [Glycomyces mayteni]
MFREVTEFGNTLPGIAHTVGEPVDATVAVLWSPESWWATSGAHLPAPVDYLENVAQIHRVLRDRGVVADFASPRATSPSTPR